VGHNLTKKAEKRITLFPCSRRAQSAAAALDAAIGSLIEIAGQRMWKRTVLSQAKAGASTQVRFTRGSHSHQRITCSRWKEGEEKKRKGVSR
jgi:hypothetical protein